MTNQTSAVATAAPAKLSGRTFTVLLVVAAVLTALACAMWASQMINGLAETSMRNLVPWGLGIVGFMFFVGLSAGSLAASALPIVCNLEQFKPASKACAWLALSCAAGAVICIVADLGSPQRTLEMVFGGNFSSPLMWDMIVLTVYAIVTIVFLVALCRSVSSGATRALAVVALVAMVCLQVVEAGIFASYNTHEYWATPLMYPWFVTTALACGTGLSIAVCVGLSKAGYLRFADGALEKAVKWLGVFVVIDLAVLCIDVAMNAANGSGIAQMLVAGQLAPFFWCQVICYAAAIVLAFTSARRKPAHAVCAGVLAILGALAKRCCMLIGGFQIANVAYAWQMTDQAIGSWQNGPAAAYSQLVYLPSAPEVGLFIGVIGAVALIALLGWKLLPLQGE